MFSCRMQCYSVGSFVHKQTLFFPVSLECVTLILFKQGSQDAFIYSLYDSIGKFIT